MSHVSFPGRKSAVVATILSLVAGCSSAPADDTTSSTNSLAESRVAATLKTRIANKFVVAENGGGGAVNADRDVAQAWETFTLVDQNGGSLESGDRVLFVSSTGQYLQAANGGGTTVNASSPNALDWETFRIVKDGGGTIGNGDVVGLQTVTSGQWLSAVNGGGGALMAYGAAYGDWEHFTIGLGAAAGAGGTSGGTTPPPPSGWKLVWSDEFDGAGGPSTAAWRYDVQKPGWVNHELENYTGDRRENSRLENGSLIIEGRRDYYQGYEYSSARLNSQKSFTYGRVEVRAKLPAGKGTWPAIWMMPDDMSRGWPACGEIDIMEHVGYDIGNVHASIHTQLYNWPMNTQKTSTLYVPGATTDFKVYALEWFADHLDAYVDGTKYFTFRNEGNDAAWPYNKPFHVILNLAIGGDWGGAMGIDPGSFPQRMEVDYVRVYQQN